MKKLLYLGVCLTVLMLLVSCSRDDSQHPPAYDLEDLSSFPLRADSLLPESPYPGWNRIDSVSVVRPAQAADHFGVLSETYLTYWFVGEASTKYAVGQDTLSVVVDQFYDNSSAYGFYARTRPNGAPIVRIGVQGYKSGDTTFFNKGDFRISLVPSPAAPTALPAVDSLGLFVAGEISAQPMIPPYYMLFPYGSRIDPSGKYYPYEYLGIPGVNKVYTTTYLVDSDTLEFFMTMDDDGKEFKYLKSYASDHGKIFENPNGFEFDQGSSLAFTYPGRGLIIAGLVRGKLVGAIGYNPRKEANERLIAGWVKGLQ